MFILNTSAWLSCFVLVVLMIFFDFLKMPLGVLSVC